MLRPVCLTNMSTGLHTATKMVEYAEYVKRILSRKVGSIGMKGEESEEGETTES